MFFDKTEKGNKILISAFCIFSTAIVKNLFVEERLGTMILYPPYLEMFINFPILVAF